MRELLGLPLAEAEAALAAAGYRVTSVETKSCKGQPGNEKRVLRVRKTAEGEAELIYALFKTDLFWTPE